MAVLKPISIATGLALLGATAHLTISKTTGYFDPSGYLDSHALLIVAIAAGVGVSSLALGGAWGERRFILALAFGVAMLFCEGFGLLQTCDRITAERERNQAPAREANAAHAKAKARVTAAELALQNSSTTRRLDAAIAQKAAADKATLEKSSEKGCVTNCRALLEQQVRSAIDELSAARSELDAKRARIEQDLDAARKTLAVTPAPASGTPLADRLGVDPTKLDMTMAALGSLGANGLAACLLAFGAHRRLHAPRIVAKAEVLEPAPATPKQKWRSPKRTKVIEAPKVDNPRQHAAQFGLECLRPDPNGETTPRSLHQRYVTWCSDSGLPTLPAPQIAQEMKALLIEAGMKFEQRDKTAVVRGITIAT